MSNPVTIQHAIDKLNTDHRVYEKRGSIHVNVCFPSVQAAISGTTSICKGLAKLCNRSVLVNIYYIQEKKLERMKRFYALRDIYRNTPTHVTQKDKREGQRNGD